MFLNKTQLEALQHKMARKLKCALSDVVIEEITVEILVHTRQEPDFPTRYWFDIDDSRDHAIQAIGDR